MTCIVVCTCEVLARDINVVVATHHQTLSDHMNKGKIISLCEEKDIPSTENWYKPEIEFYILCKALRMGGLNPTFEFKIYPSSYRSEREARHGVFLTRAFAPWVFDGDDNSDFYVSDAIIRNGEVFVGIFTRSDNTELMQVKSVEELQKFKAVSTQNWPVDWHTLACLNIKAYSVSSRLQMFRMVHAKRADFTLSAFTARDDYSHVLTGIRLVPVPGVKIAFNGSRRFLIYKKYPNSKLVFEALQNGIRELRRSNAIRRMFVESGYFPSGLDHWKVLKCAEGGA